MDLMGETLVLSEKGIHLLAGRAHSIGKLQNGSRALAEDGGGENARGLATPVIWTGWRVVAYSPCIQ